MYSTILLFVVVISSASAFNQLLTNNVGDYLLSQLLKNQHHVWSLPELITEDWELKMGVVSSVPTIKRDGDIKLTVNDNTVSITLPLTIEKFRVTFFGFKIKAMGLEFTEVLDFTAKNRFEVEGTMQKTSLCFATINKVTITELTDFKLGMGPNKSRLEILSSDVFKAQIQDGLQITIDQLMHKFLVPFKGFCPETKSPIRG